MTYAKSVNFQAVEVQEVTVLVEEEVLSSLTLRRILLLKAEQRALQCVMVNHHPSTILAAAVVEDKLEATVKMDT
jgi:hypothetical protein